MTTPEDGGTSFKHKMQAAPTPSTLRRSGSILWQALRLVLFVSKRHAPNSGATPTFLVLLALLDVAAVVAGGYLASPDGSVFDPAGLPVCLAGQGLILIVAASLWSVFDDQQRPLDRLAVAFGALLIIDLLWLGLQFAAATLVRIDEVWPRPLPLAGVIGTWLGLALAFAWSRQSQGFARGFLIAFCVLVVFGVPATMLDRGAPVWLAAGASADPSADDDDVQQRLRVDEALLYGEADLLQQAIDALAPRTPGKINLYFLGFAGNGEQRVFTREVSYVDAVFEKRFGAAGHSLLLENNFTSPGQVPLATATSLRVALQAIGQHMHDEDLLVLFLDSHGSREAGVNVDMPPFDFQDIDPKSLTQMLDAAHIRQRVVIVSACYAGIFVEPLANANTLVITAADATHTSFGCSNEADFTYFGRAYFHDALSTTNSFSEAFDKALPLIRDREDQQGFAHSNPQMKEGASIRQSLQLFASQLPQVPRSTEPQP